MSRCPDLGRVGRVPFLNRFGNESHHVELGVHTRVWVSCPIGLLVRGADAPFRRVDTGELVAARERLAHSCCGLTDHLRSSSLDSVRLASLVFAWVRTQARDTVLRAVSRRVSTRCALEPRGLVERASSEEVTSRSVTTPVDRSPSKRGTRRFPLIPRGNRFLASRSRLSARDISAIRIVFSRNVRSVEAQTRASRDRSASRRGSSLSPTLSPKSALGAAPTRFRETLHATRGQHGVEGVAW